MIILQVMRSQSNSVASEVDTILYAGTSLELFSFVSVSNLSVRRGLSAVLPMGLYARALELPGILSRSCQFIISISTSLALLNCAPVYLADGSLILTLLAEYLTSDEQIPISPFSPLPYLRMIAWILIVPGAQPPITSGISSGNVSGRLSEATAKRVDLILFLGTTALVINVSLSLILTII
jgi:hypothetical protein